MFTLKIISDDAIDIYQALDVRVVDEHSGNDELKAHIADLNIKAANLANASSTIADPVRHDDMKAAIFAGDRSAYLFPGDRCYITNDDGKTVHSLNYTVKEKRPANDFEKLVAKLAVDGGCIVSSADCGEIEIADAKCRDDFYATEKGYGYVRRLPEWLQKHSRFARGAADNNCEEIVIVRPDINRVQLATDANDLYYKIEKSRSFGMKLDKLRDALEFYYNGAKS